MGALTVPFNSQRSEWRLGIPILAHHIKLQVYLCVLVICEVLIADTPLWRLSKLQGGAVMTFPF